MEKEIITAVNAMREAQKGYFRTRDKTCTYRGAAIKVLRGEGFEIH